MVKLKLAITGVTHTKAKPDFDLDLKFGQQHENELQKAIEGKLNVRQIEYVRRQVMFL
jgi:hypothetical protein